jgi:hypothetical protein
VLTRAFPPELVDEVVAECGRVEQRHRLLPARVVVYFVLEVAPGVWTQGFHAARESLAGAWCRCSNSSGER